MGGGAFHHLGHVLCCNSTWFLVALSIMTLLSAYGWRERCVDCEGTMAASAVLWANFTLSMFLWAMRATAATPWIYPLMHLCAGLAILLSFWGRAALWKRMVVFCFAAELIADILKGANVAGQEREIYKWALNSLMAAEIALISFPGGKYAASRFFDWMFPTVRLGDFPSDEVG